MGVCEAVLSVCMGTAPGVSGENTLPLALMIPLGSVDGPKAYLLPFAQNACLPPPHLIRSRLRLLCPSPINNDANDRLQKRLDYVALRLLWQKVVSLFHCMD
jgi:hypothetical protein